MGLRDFLLVLVSVAVPIIALEIAKDCSKATTPCELPCCRCISNAIPNNFTATQTPQFVMLTFDDAIAASNMKIYEDIANFKNPNGCPIAVTFFVSHEYNDYALTYDLWQKGHEIAVSSISQKGNTYYWKNLSKEGWVNEIGGMKKLLHKYAKIPSDDILGVRVPSLQPGGDTQFEGMEEADLYWDYSMSTWSKTDLWPFSLDHKSDMDCRVPPCPQSSFQNMWVIPILDLAHLNSRCFEEPCSTIDSCPTDTEEETYKLLMENFKRNYNAGGNRAPFGVHTQVAWFLHPSGQGRLKAYKRFIQEVLTYQDVYFVSTSQALDWMQNPQEVDKYKANTFRVCDSLRRARTNRCRVKQRCVYYLDSVEHNMYICGKPNDCPTSPIVPGGKI